MGWQRSASFSLVLLCDRDPKLNISKDTHHTFNAREPDWGFTQFAPLADIGEYITNDTLKIACEVHIKKDLYSFSAYDSKKETGYIGFKNQGATCYMNSLLQTLYHIPVFRKAVYHMPTTETDVPESSIPLALQTLFYKMQFQETSVSTKELTKSFGWDQLDSFTQHDVQELNRVLCEKLEEKMKGTCVENTIQRLFEGKTMGYVECINVDYKSTRTEAFQDLQLDVKGCKDVYASFGKYVEVEKLEGPNQYQAEGHGLQDAKKGVWFVEFPPVLELQLKRFDYDFQRDMMVKINDRYEFPEELDLDSFLAPTATRDPARPNQYTLHSVLVHSGGVHGGHYYAFIRPGVAKGAQWYKFDDERVTKEEPQKAVDEQFGGDDEPGYTNPPTFKFARFSNAYMLVYVRNCDRDYVVCDVAEEDIALHLRLRIKREAEERAQKKKEKEEAHLYTIVKIATDKDLFQQIGTDIHFDLVDHDKVKVYRVVKETPFAELQKRVEADLGVPVNCQRYWTWARRQNQTYRPNRPLRPEEEAVTVAELKVEKDNDLRLLLETAFPATTVPQPPPEIRKEDILLFFKHYDPEASKLRFAGWKFESVKTQVSALREFCNTLAGYPPNTELRFYEEIKSEPLMCEQLPLANTLKTCQLEDGDIICFQRRADSPPARFAAVPDYLMYVKERLAITFRELNNKSKDLGFVLELLRHYTYDDVTTRLAERLNVADPNTIRLTAHNNYTHMPMPKPIRFRVPERVLEMVTQHSQVTDTLYYEVLDMPVGEVEKLKVLKVAFNNAKTEEVGTFTVRLPKDLTVADVLEDLRKQLGDKVAPGAELRMFEMFYNKIFKVFSPTDKIDTIIESYWHLRAEEVPEEEKGLQAKERVIHVYHFTPGPTVTNFGDPFLLKVGDDEPLSSVKKRIQSKLGVADEEFAKWKVASVQQSKVEYLTDDTEAVAARFRRETYGAYESYLGLEHEDKHPKRSNNRYPAEKAVKIYN